MAQATIKAALVVTSKVSAAFAEELRPAKYDLNKADRYVIARAANIDVPAVQAKSDAYVLGSCHVDIQNVLSSSAKDTVTTKK